ncbi:MAG: histidinol dehydrogenase [Sedimentisphaerales bacterium]|nr:histidinol dehydrogenase [Sedimentisphaerales bacterium]
MGNLKIVQTRQADFRSQWRQLLGKLTLQAALLDDTRRLEQVRQIVAQVRSGKDAALAELTARIDRVELEPREFRVPEPQLQEAHERMDPELLAALRQSIANVREYQEAIKVKHIDDWTQDGVRLGVRYRPIRRVGVCVPGASAPLVSTAVMTAVPAQVAGVKEIAVISAPKPEHNNSIHPDILGVCWELGITEVYRISGAQAVAALAFGTKTIPKVDKIVGPGGWWVQLAKKEVYGLVDIDSFAGPSEVLILADDSANPAWVAADMLSQAEHAPGSAVLLTDSESLAAAVAKQLDTQLDQLGRSENTRQCVAEFCRAVVTRDIDELVELANEFAAEHVQVQCRDSEAIAERVVNAGAMFIGHHTPVATGDYLAGPSHTLPTGGSARFFSALNVNDFIKQTSVIGYDEQALQNAAKAIEAMANAEGLDAHARSVSRRVEG